MHVRHYRQILAKFAPHSPKRLSFFRRYGRRIPLRTHLRSPHAALVSTEQVARSSLSTSSPIWSSEVMEGGANAGVSGRAVTAASASGVVGAPEWSVAVRRARLCAAITITESPVTCLSCCVYFYYRTAVVNNHGHNRNCRLSLGSR